jgi:hypothetical protein
MTEMLNTFYNSMEIIPALLLLVALGLHVGWLSSNNVNNEILDLICVILIGLTFAYCIYKTSNILAIGAVPPASNFINPSLFILVLYIIMGVFRPFPYNNSNRKELRNWSLGLGVASVGSLFIINHFESQ